MSEILHGNFKNSCITCKQTPEEMLQTFFRKHFLYVIVHIKTSMSIERQRILHQGGF